MIKKSLILLFLSICYITNAQQVRHIETINDLWSFHKGSIENPFSQESSTDWENVIIPHSWNTEDILDDEDGYYRGDGWYKKNLVISQVYENQQVFLLFEGVNQITSLFVNGKPVGEDHIGGYTTFTRDITSALKSGENEIYIKVNNAHNDEIISQAADFSFYGGIYRDIQLIITKSVHFEVENIGANTVFYYNSRSFGSCGKSICKVKINKTKKRKVLCKTNVI